jgi:hypothetical protein
MAPLTHVVMVMRGIGFAPIILYIVN